jgi:hypothetical protein
MVEEMEMKAAETMAAMVMVEEMVMVETRVSRLLLNGI